MSTQYIIKFIKSSLEVEVDGFVELKKNKNNIPIITVRTHKDRSNSSNTTLLHKFMTNNFAVITFTDNKCSLSFADGITSTILFDNSSSSAFSEFKKNFNDYYNSKYETEYYPNSTVELYIGPVLYKKDTTDNVIERQPHGVGTLYYNLPDHKIKYYGEFESGVFDGTGTFYTSDNNISITANNISKGIPTQNGKININFSKTQEVIDINFNEIWKQFNISDKEAKRLFVMSDTFVNDVAKKYIKNLDCLEFQDKTVGDKYNEIWTILTEQNKQLNINHITMIKQINELKSFVCKTTILIIFTILLSFLI